MGTALSGAFSPSPPHPALSILPLIPPFFQTPQHPLATAHFCRWHATKPVKGPAVRTPAERESSMRRLRAGAILSLLPQLGFWGAAKLLTRDEAPGFTYNAGDPEGRHARTIFGGRPEATPSFSRRHRPRPANCRKLSRAAAHDGFARCWLQSFQKFLNRSGAISV